MKIIGNYNPHIPRILGQEWAPIRDESIIFAPSINAVEYGHTFVLDTSRTVTTGQVFLNTPPDSQSRQVLWVSLYDASDLGMGPIEQVTIPVTGGGVTGTGVAASGNSVALALLSPNSSNEVAFTTPDGTEKSMGLFFGIDQYLQLLTGKRILGMEFLYSAYAYSQDVSTSDYIPFPPDEIRNVSLGIQNAVINTQYDGFILGGINYTGGFQSINTKVVASEFLGETNFNTGTLTGVNNAPMGITDLRRFAFPSSLSAGSRLMFRIAIETSSTDNPNNRIAFNYAALRVTYCEEKRLGVAASRLNRRGINVASMLDVATHTTNPTLSAGTYLVTVSAPALGDLQSDSTSLSAVYSQINANRQLYPIPSHTGIQINIPSDITNSVGSVITHEETDILPQLSLNTSSAPLTEVHAYGRQAVAQVWGSHTATQDIYDVPVGSSQSFPWVRFYARRFGDTTIPLTIDSPSIVGPSASITPEEFDELDEVLAGWKEVTLRFSSAPSMGTGTNPIWRWSATGEDVGNRWEILGATAPAISGIAGNLMNLAPTYLRPYSATYGAPVSGAGINLAWIPQYAPPVSAVVDDESSDATLLFAVDLPTVTGFAVTTLTQELAGIGQSCNMDPCGIPSALLYNQLTWSATSSAVPTSGFGYYEMQRMDTVETDWQTIMEGTSPTGASYNDYEARIGIETSYRIRAVDVYGFYGEWSDTVSITIPAPGVSGECIEGGHILVFTTNERQDGTDNLAYSSVWMDNRVAEDFAFPESQTVQLQPMYNRDYFTAFRPLERGGEQFSRTVLVQAAAIDPETLADFTSLRDMAWDTVNYICVRDEDGNRWFATVNVPSGVVMKNRTLYLASVNIAEVTDTPTPVDPWS